MWVGARCAYIISGKARLGVVTALGEDRHAFKLDSGTTVPVSADRLQLVNNWRDRSRDLEANTLKLYPRGSDALEIFKDKHGVTFGVAAMRSMWYWGNFYIFHKVLKEPKLLISTDRKTYGRYRKDRGKKYGRIIASSRNHNLAELFATMLHEQIHQYNFEIDYPKGEFNPQDEGVHGQIFLKWIPIIREKTGVVIKVTGDPSQDDTVFDQGTDDESTTQPFIFAVIRLGQGSEWLGFTFKDKYDLTIFTGEVGSYLMQSNALDENVYAGTCTLARVKQEFQFVRNGHLNLRAIKNKPAVSVVKLAVQNGKPIDGWRLPRSTAFS